MQAGLILLSEQREDLAIARYLSSGLNLVLSTRTKAHELRSFLIDHPQSIVIFDAGEQGMTELAAGFANLPVGPFKIFGISAEPLNQYPHLQGAQFFGHHLLRRLAPPLPTLLAKLIQASLTPFPFGMERMFPAHTKIQHLRLANSAHKKPAVDAMQNFLVSQTVQERIAALISTAFDELLMNAIFDAPIDANQQRYRRHTPRNAAFELQEKEAVEISFAACPDYLGILVADQFGSIKKDTLLSFIHKDYQSRSYEVREDDPGAGLGLHAINQSGISLVFTAKPGVRTEVSIVVPQCRSYRQFRKSFQFLSILA